MCLQQWKGKTDMYAFLRTIPLLLTGCALISEEEKRDMEQRQGEVTDSDGDGASEFGGDCDDSDPDLNIQDTDGDGHTSCGGDCDDGDVSTYPGAAYNEDLGCVTDADGDGYALESDGGTDCDDGNASISPDATEVCDDTDTDEDCDGLAGDADGSLDSGTGTVFYADADGDGYGDAASTIQTCAMPDGYVADSTDCDDGDASVFPGNLENEGAGCHIDADGDGWGDSGAAAGIDPGQDCNDAEAAINLEATEVCDGADNDCDTLVDDEDDSTDLSTGDVFYADTDADGFGDSDAATQACVVPAGHVSDSTDCDDAAAAVFPGNLPSEGAGCHIDSDSDGWGDASAAAGIDPGNDCDDAVNAVSPDADEICDEDDTDEDCSGAAEDDATDASTWYADSDGDGFGDAESTTAACELPSGHVSNSTDCNDAEALIRPDAAEVCDGFDNDCDGAVDSADIGIVYSEENVYYADVDLDGYGDSDASAEACSQPDGHVTNNEDCNDSVSAISPVADEICDDDDNDCNGAVDEDQAIDASTWFEDGDGDGFGDSGSTEVACVASVGFVEDSTDCNDAEALINPDAAEVCDSIDNDCNGAVDGADMGIVYSDENAHYDDVDLDGYGDPDVSVVACTQPAGHVNNGEDCNDADDTVNPEAEEGPADSMDTNCDGYELCYADEDGDSFGGALTVSATTLACNAAGQSMVNTDCDDTSSEVYPGAVAEAESDECMLDADGDGFGDSADSQIHDAGSDCDDDSAVYGSIDLDSDCNGVEDMVVPEGCYLAPCDSSIELDSDAGTGIDFVDIPAGEDPLGRYTLTNGFEVMATEMTQGMFLSLMGYDSRDGEDTDYGDGTDHPAYYVDWHMAAAAANALSAEAGLSGCYSCEGTGTDVACSQSESLGSVYLCEGYRLPTDAEWDYAARSGTTEDIWTGGGSGLGGAASTGCGSEETIEDGADNPYLAHFAWGCGTSGSEAHAVAKLRPNGFGLYDTTGNVWEWTNDRHGEDFPVGSTDPEGPVEGVYRVTRGGDWGSDWHNLLVPYRRLTSPTQRADGNGFRLARTLPRDEDGDGVSHFSDCDDGSADYGSIGLDSDCNGIEDAAEGIPEGCHFAPCDSSIVLDGDAGTGIDFVEIPAGEDPLERYVLTNDFELMSTEVTQGMFEALMDYDPLDGQSTLYGEGADIPLYYVSWHMAADYANAVSALEGLDECYTCSDPGAESVSCTESLPHGSFYTCGGYRLPTEAEWEYAARSGTTSDYWTGEGDDLGGSASSVDGSGNSACEDVYILDGATDPPMTDYIWYCENFDGAFEAPGQLLPNGFGLYGMAGSVWEWTNDWHGSQYAVETDPEGVSYESLSDGSTGENRIVRGGTALAGARPLSVFLYNAPEAVYDNLGFRLARTLPAVVGTDADGDGYISESDGGDDCADGDSGIHPDAADIPNDGIDQDCSGSDAQEEAEDSDGDGSASDADCDDADATVHPSAEELCDGQYNDCDNVLYSASEPPADEEDSDGDGYVVCPYDAAVWTGSEEVSGGGDCDDSESSLFPGNAANEGAGCHLDADRDGWGDDSTGGSIDPGSDCDDGEATIHPFAAEVSGDSVDSNCDGIEDANWTDCDAAGSQYDAYYVVCGVFTTRADGTAICEGAGYDGLAMVPNASGNASLASLVASQAWLSYVYTFGDWAWLDGSPNSYDNWGAGEPAETPDSFSGDEGCAIIDNTGAWSSFLCDSASQRKLSCSYHP
jgi:formylglycine-generating enzyme required for sulfatase activity